MAKRTKKEVAQHPIDTRLAELGKKRAWLAERVDRSPQCIGQYCNRQRTLDPDGRLVKQICDEMKGHYLRLEELSATPIASAVRDKVHGPELTWNN